MAASSPTSGWGAGYGSIGNAAARYPAEGLRNHCLVAWHSGAEARRSEGEAGGRGCNASRERASGSVECAEEASRGKSASPEDGTVAQVQWHPDEPGWRVDAPLPDTVRQVADDLLGVGENNSSSSIAERALEGLPAAYDGVLDAIAFGGITTISLDSIQPMLLMAEQRIKSRAAEHGGGGAFGGFAGVQQPTQQLSNGDGGRGRGRGRGQHRGGGRGGGRNSSRGGGRGGGRAPVVNTSKATGECWDCGQLGHYRGDKICPGKELVLVAGQADRSGACDSKTWVIDSGAGRHATCDLSILSDYKELDATERIEIVNASGGLERAQGVGTVRLIIGSTTHKVLKVREVYYFPALRFSLISVGLAMKRGADIRMDSDGIHFWDSRSKQRPLATAPWVGNTARLTCVPMKASFVSCMMAAGTVGASSSSQQPAAGTVGARLSKQMLEAQRLHEALGHPSKKVLADAVANGKVDGVDSRLVSAIKQLPSCESCIMAKQARLTFGESTRKNDFLPGELLHMDVWGPARVPTIRGERFFVTATDQHGKLAMAQLLVGKDGAGAFAKSAVLRYENISGNSVKTVRFDRGGEFVSKDLINFFENRGTRWETTTSYTSQQNGVAEKLNRDLLDKVRAQLIASGMHRGVGRRMWGEALMLSVYQRNRLPHSDLPGQITPWESMFGRAPDVSHMQPFGTTAFVLKLPRHQSGAGKLDPVSMRGKLVGYSAHSKAYRVLLDPEHRDNHGAVVESRDVTFLAPPVKAMKEDPPPLMDDDDDEEEELQPAGDDTAAAADPQPGDVAAEEPGEGEAAVTGGEPAAAEPRRSQRARTAPVRYAAAAVDVSTDRVFEPKNTKEARSSPDAKHWLAAEDEELQSMWDNGVLIPAKLPVGKRAIKTRMIYKVKYDQLGKPIRYKARLVALGFFQREGEDYTEVFAPVGRQSTLRMVLAWAADNGLVVHQMDVKTAFLQADLEEDIYITLPPEVQSGDGDLVVYKAEKAIYGLKQAPRAWYDTLRGALEGFEFVAGDADTALFVRRGKYGNTVIICHVDDMLFVGSDEDVAAAKDQVKSAFEVTDLGEVAYHLGMEVTRDWDKGTISLSQRKYTAEVLARFGMTDARYAKVPADPKSKLQAAVGDPLDAAGISLYREKVGCLMYLASCTRPDISQTVGALARFMSAPTSVHNKAVRQVMRYLAGTRDLGLVYGGSDQTNQPYGYSDADWAGDLDSRRSTSGFVFLMAGAAVSWGSKLMQGVCTSTQESEYKAGARACKEAIWLTQLCGDLGIEVDCMIIKGDNTAAIALASNPMVAERSKHIDVQHHFLRERVMSGEVEFNYLPTNLMVADSLTKAVDGPKVVFCREGMGLRVIRI